MINQLISDQFEQQFAIEGVTLDNMEQVYNPFFSKQSPSISETRHRLIQLGMDVGFADRLAHKYLQKISENAHICTVMDLFCDPKSKMALHRPDLSIKDLPLNYTAVKPTIFNRKQFSTEKFGHHSSLTPVSIRMFGSKNKAEHN